MKNESGPGDAERVREEGGEGGGGLREGGRDRKAEGGRKKGTL